MQDAPMSRARFMQENRKMRFEEAGWTQGRLTQAEAALLLGQCERSFRRHIERYEADGLEGLLDRRLRRVSKRRAGGAEVDRVVALYKSSFAGWSVAHSKYKCEFAGARSYSWLKQARGWSERAFQTHQGRLPQELARAGIPDMASANRYLEQIYRLGHNREFCVPSTLPGTAYVPFLSGSLPDILCEQHERTVGNDNCVSFAGLSLQIPCDALRHHYVRARVRVHRYVDAMLAVFHGPRKLAAYDVRGLPATDKEVLRLAA